MIAMREPDIAGTVIPGKILEADARASAMPRGYVRMEVNGTFRVRIELIDPGATLNIEIKAKSSLEEELETLAEEWIASRGIMSFSARAATHPAYQKIIGKGLPAVPFLLRRLREKPDHWFLALSEITKVNPIPPEDYGIIKKMADAWILWGSNGGYI